MGNTLIFITGGARSGKSSFALRLADTFEGRKIFVATAQPLDEEMRIRIEKHKRERTSAWETLEVPLELVQGITISSANHEVLVIDCLTLWISNLLIEGKKTGEEILHLTDMLVESCKNVEGTVLIVSNEVGSGIVPGNSLARHFRDLVGIINQKVASHADEVYLLVSGSPLRLKGSIL